MANWKFFVFSKSIKFFFFFWENKDNYKFTWATESIVMFYFWEIFLIVMKQHSYSKQSIKAKIYG